MAVAPGAGLVERSAPEMILVVPAMAAAAAAVAAFAVARGVEGGRASMRCQLCGLLYVYVYVYVE